MELVDDIAINTYSIFGVILIFFLFVNWFYSQAIGFKSIYLLLLTTYLYDAINQYMAAIKPSLQLKTLLTPDLSILLVTVVTAIMFSELSRAAHRLLLMAGSFFLFLLIIFIQDISSVYTIVTSILIGLFITYTADYTSTWYYRTPDSFRLSMAILFPVSLYFLNPTEISLILCGVLIGLGEGYLIEQIKVRLLMTNHKLVKRLGAVIVGFTGLLLIYWIDATTANSVFSQWLYSIISGAWITWLAPLVFVLFSFYTRQEGHFISEEHQFSAKKIN